MTEKGKGKKRGGKEASMTTSEAGNHWIRRRASNEAGQVLIITVLAMVVLIGSLALAADVGFWRYMRRNMQKAADAGAIAGASENIYIVGLDNVVAAARWDTKKNGFEHGKDGVEVTVYNPPVNGPHKDRPEKDNYVEVIISQNQPTFFAKIFGRTSQMVSARAVAYGGSEKGPALGCVYSLYPNHTGESAFFVQGSNTIVDADCNICISSDDPIAALKVGGGATVKTTGISVTGKAFIESGNVYDRDGNTLERGGPAFVEGAPPCPDPFSYMQPPPVGTCNYNNIKIKNDVNLSPGVYCGGIAVQAGAIVTFNPGLYILNGGGLKTNSGSTLIGNGVTFYNTGGGDIDINGNAATVLKAPMSGDYAGMLFWQDPQNTQEGKFNGNSDTILEGALYFPSADLKWTGGNSTNAGYAIVVANKVKFAGSATFNITNVNSPFETSGTEPPTPRVMLVE